MHFLLNFQINHMHQWKDEVFGGMPDHATPEEAQLLERSTNHSMHA